MEKLAAKSKTEASKKAAKKVANETSQGSDGGGAHADKEDEEEDEELGADETAKDIVSVLSSDEDLGKCEKMLTPKAEI